MKKTSNRAIAVVLLIALVLFGTGVYIYRYSEHGNEWALYFYRSNSGSSGTITDRNGATLASFSPAGNYYSEDKNTRAACFHILGDYNGRTGAGILDTLSSGIKEYDIFTGTTEAKHYDFSLTLDAELSKVCLGAMGDYRGCVLISNYKTGEILALVSTPTIDPLDTVEEPEEGTYVNKCLCGTYTPGSVFKLITTAAAIETVPNIYDRTFWCENEYDVAGVTITCMGPHYTTDINTALSNSCNCAFAQIALAVGQDNMKKYVSDYGLTSSYELGGITTAAGNFETAYMGDPELAWAGIGQWTDLVCPYALLRFIQAVGNGGTLVEPYLVEGDGSSGETALVRADTAATLKSMMAFNVTDHYGQENFEGLKLCAKTGTAEVGDGTNNAWFAGFLDDAEHPYAFVVVVEDGGYGITSAGGVANTVLQYAVTRSDLAVKHEITAAEENPENG